MALKIRLARGGRKKQPFYRLVVAEATSPRDGKFIEKLGTYNPVKKENNGPIVVLVNERIQYWLSVGAQPTDVVTKLIKKAGIELPKHISVKLEIRSEARKAKTEKLLAEKAEAEKVAAEKAEAEKAEAEKVEAEKVAESESSAEI